jgi:hypothetical protein
MALCLTALHFFSVPYTASLCLTFAVDVRVFGRMQVVVRRFHVSVLEEL